MEKEQLIKNAKKGLLALAELQIIELEDSNKELINMLEKESTTLPPIMRNYEKIRDRYYSIWNMYSNLVNDKEFPKKLGERYSNAASKRLKIADKYKQRYNIK